MTAFRGRWPGPVWALARALMLAAAFLALSALSAIGADRAQLIATSETGFGRLAISFPERLDLPAYRLKFENNVLAIEFDEAIEILLPDVAVMVPDYVMVARVDPDRRGIRFGLRTAFQVSRLEAGEKLFVDLLPSSWQGLPPALPQEIVDELAERAQKAAIVAERRRKLEEARVLKPTATVRVGQNPTFVRVQFDWSIETKGELKVEGPSARVSFDWPVEVDIYDLKSNLPKEVLSVGNKVDEDGSHIDLHVAEGVVPRFYTTSDRSFILDIDIDRESGIAAALAAEEAAQREREAVAAMSESLASKDEPEKGTEPSWTKPTAVVPAVSMVGGTVRVTFPFEQDTAAAVFRRGDVVWMIFDTSVPIEAPRNRDLLKAIASSFDVVPAGNTKVVRMDLVAERLATLGSEGRSWVLSLGDVLLNPTEPVAFGRQRDEHGFMRMKANLGHPSRIHDFRDPVVGDMLRVVTAFPPARGVARDLDYVDFEVLRSVHGLVIKGNNETLEVSIADTDTVLSAKQGLSLSVVESAMARGAQEAPEARASYLDLVAGRREDPAALVDRREELIDRAAQTEGRARDLARLELAQFHIANQFAHEAIGVLRVLEASLASDDLRGKVNLARGIADTLAVRPNDALAILSAEGFDDDVDALMWRSIAKAQANDFVGAREDALASEPVLDIYPNWVRLRFLLNAVRSAIETNDLPNATRLLERIEFAQLDAEQVATYRLLQARIAEAQGRDDEALDGYGQVIAAEFRPSRAEAVYRTLLVLDRTGKIDLAKATDTLAAEAMTWRGNRLEAEMQVLLAQLYFRRKEYRDGFETVRVAASTHPESPSTVALLETAQTVFTDLYLNGRADELDPVEALALYYDFQQLTPPGTRGDEMVRNLARRLVKVDLLAQAADLLEYQIDTRLKGVAQAQIAADLAIIRIANRDPEGALRVLNRTRLNGLSPLLDRQRRILEARALVDAGRESLALDLLGRLNGREIDMLRVEAYWQAKNYGIAGELLEVALSPASHPGPLTQPDRMQVVKAAVAFVLANDRLALSRIRSKFSEQMAQTAEWAMFDFVTRDLAPSSIEFKKVAREVSGLDTLDAFLDAYRRNYAAGDPMTPERAVPLSSEA